MRCSHFGFAVFHSRDLQVPRADSMPGLFPVPELFAVPCTEAPSCSTVAPDEQCHICEARSMRQDFFRYVRVANTGWWYRVCTDCAVRAIGQEPRPRNDQELDQKLYSQCQAVAHKVQIGEDRKRRRVSLFA